MHVVVVAVSVDFPALHERDRVGPHADRDHRRRLLWVGDGGGRFGGAGGGRPHFKVKVKVAKGAGQGHHALGVFPMPCCPSCLPGPRDVDGNFRDGGSEAARVTSFSHAAAVVGAGEAVPETGSTKDRMFYLSC